MPKTSQLTLSVARLVACFLPVAAASLATANDVLTINVNRRGPRLNTTQYGVFFEEINHAGDGGLYAELIQNRSFEDDTRTPAAWSLFRTGSAAGRMALDTADLLNAAQYHSLRVDLQGPGGTVGVANGGFWGINVRQGQEYRLSLFARSGLGAAGKIAARLQSADGSATYASAEITDLSPKWKKHSLTLQPNGSATNGRLALEISSDQAGSVWLDVVSLFPPTWKGRPNGLRPDLADAIADLKPGFIRFPGGSFVSENRIECVPKWKTEIGPIEARPGHPAPGQVHHWKYRSSDGLGYHEYLQLAEDLGAAPIFCTSGGVSNHNFVPLAELGPWVQDVLDAIEYANGPADSTWGGKRVANGHPKPFGLKYLQIGNENFRAPYHENYKAFYRAIKAKYPEVQVIWSGNWQGNQQNTFGYRWDGIMPGGSAADVIDEHFYYDPKWLMARVHRFDAKNYPRDKPGAAKIFLGEVSAAQDTLGAALGEAAFLLGAERNSDKVVMACYAPLMAHAGQKNWPGNAIYFDTHRVYKTPSYYVQKMLAENRGDVNLAAGGLKGLLDATVFVNATLEEASGDILVKIVNANPAKGITIELPGISPPPRAAVVTVLSAADKSAGNSFDAPTRVAPRTKKLDAIQWPLRYTLEANSFTVFRVSAKQ